jgi:hypothetical protein
MADPAKGPECDPPESELPHGRPMSPNTGDMPPPRLPPAPEDDPAPLNKESAPDIDDVPGL